MLLLPHKDKKKNRFLYMMNQSGVNRVLYSKAEIPELERLCNPADSSKFYPTHPTLMTGKERKWNRNINILNFFLAALFAYSLVTLFSNPNPASILYVILYPFICITSGSNYTNFLLPINKERFLIYLSSNNPSDTRLGAESQAGVEGETVDYLVKDVKDVIHIFELARLRAEANGYGYSISTPNQQTMNEFSKVLKGYKSQIPQMDGIMNMKSMMRKVMELNVSTQKQFDTIAELMLLERDYDSLSQAQNDFYQGKDVDGLSLCSDLEIEIMNKKLLLNELNGHRMISD